MISFCNKVIEYSFYAILFLVPLVFAGNTSELFEFNKMWVAFAFTIFIFVAWATKSILERKVTVQRTLLDIPILLFLLSQIISTIFSLDQHVSWWGYYSRFNGGLLSTITYIFLYYAFVSNLSLKHVFRSIYVILFGGLVVALWGLPSHFGYDPTCLVFRGTFDTTCWTEAFRPTVRVFSTLGQPAWLAAYLAALLPLTIAFALKQKEFKPLDMKFIALMALMVLFFLNLIFANTRAGFIAFIFANVLFWAIIFLKKLFTRRVFVKYFLIVNFILYTCVFFYNSPLAGLYPFTLAGIQSNFASKPTPPPAPLNTQPQEQASPNTQQPAQNAQPETPKQAPPPSESGITDSGNIRLYVWRGAIDAWKSNALFGTGVETFAFAYYKFRPAGHNLTSEWDYLYNKAHNEYLNYLTTTGAFGLGTYLFFIGLFIFHAAKKMFKDLKSEKAHSAEYVNRTLITTGLFTGWTSILITNFFGFSVVIMNIFLFLAPLFILMIEDLNPEKSWSFSFGTPSHSTSPYQWTFITIVWVLAGYWLITLSNYWYADTKYALGYNLDHVGSYQDAYPLLIESVKVKPKEAVYADELALNMAVLSTAFAQQNDAANTQQFASQAIELSNKVTTEHPNNVVYWKNRVRLFYTLAQANPNQQINYYQEALKAIEVANTLAPTDAKIKYNLGVLYGQTGNLANGIAILQDTITLKPDYRDAYFALGLFYYQSSLDPNGNYVVKPELKQKAIETYNYIIANINPHDQEVKKSLDEWGAAN